MQESEKKKPVNNLSQSGMIEDLAWSIVQDIASEFHLSRAIISILRDKRDDLANELSYDVEIDNLIEQQNDIRAVRYDKQNILYLICGADGDSKQSCTFKHQSDSLATIHDAWAANLDEKYEDAFRDLYFKTSNNWAISLAKFVGIEVEACSACLFEKLKIEERESDFNG